MDGIGRLALCNVNMGKLHSKYDESCDDFDMKENYIMKEGEFQMGSLVSSQIDNFYQCQENVREANEQKMLLEDEICNSSIDIIVAEIRSKVLPRGDKAFTTLIFQFQSCDEFNTKEITKEQFLTALGYFKCFHLSDTQIKKLYEHFMIKSSKKINYISFTKAVAGPLNKSRVDHAKDILSDLS